MNTEGQIISIGSGALTVSVVPACGAQIVSLRDTSGHEYLAPGVVPRPADLPLMASYNDGGLGGIDDCVPSIAPDQYPAAPYAGWAIPDHGDAWQRPWSILHTAADELELTVGGSHLPYVLTRHMVVEGHSLSVAYTLSNQGDAEMPILWAAHPLLRATAKANIDIGSPEVLLVEACNLELNPGESIPYPLVELRGQQIDLRRWDSLPQGFYLKAFAPLASGAVATLRHPDWGTALEVVTEAQQQLHMGIWMNCAGFPEDQPVEHLALEPTFGAADALSRALEMGNCLFLAPGGEERWTVTYRIVELS